MKLKRRNRINRIKYASLAFMVLFLLMVVPSHAKDHAARLKECLQTDIMYYSSKIVKFNVGIKSNNETFRKEYDGRYVVLSGNKVDSISKNKKEIVIVDDFGQLCTVGTSDDEVKPLIDGLKIGDHLNVYGKLSITGWNKDSYRIEAKRISINSKSCFEEGNYVFFSEDEFKGTLVDDLNSAKTVRFYIPADWKKKYVQDDLKNNGVKGYQYYLNAISPQNIEHPEIFSIFFFDYETYLEKVPVNPSDGDKKDIEEAIIRNILENTDTKFKVTIETIKDANGSKIDYFSTTHRAGDGGDYRLEFLFKPGKKGITSMLYIYYPKETAVRHVRDVAYLIETMVVE